MNSTIYKTTLLILIASVLFSCEETIHPSLEEASPVLVVDAWITDRPEPQKIKLTRTQPYFESTLPAGVTGATVTIADNNGKVYLFFPDSEAGTYVWIPVGDEVFGKVGLNYTLTISENGEVFEAKSNMGRVPVIDSITFFNQEAGQFNKELFFAEFWATDPEEVGDAYWIKTYRNGELLNKPADINIAYDAGFTRGSEFSGVTFIPPIRTAINPFDENEDGTIKSPYNLGDSVYVEIHSLSENAFDFLTQVFIQTARPGGFAELFSTPLANVPTNIKNKNPNGSKPVGFFNVSAVAGLGRKLNSREDLSKRD